MKSNRTTLCLRILALLACFPARTDAQGPGPTIVCPGDGSLTLCPCGNNSPSGSGLGCLNSTGSGGKLGAAGSSSLSNDTLVFSASGMSAGTVVFFQGTALQTPVFLADGLRCAGGVLQRLKSTTSTNGMAQYPTGNDSPASQQGQVTQPGTRFYQTWYEDTAPQFCTSGTNNLTNGVAVIWVP